MTNIRKDYIWNTVGTSANSFISLLLLIVVTRINGIDASGIFGFCFSYAILFFTIGLFGGRIYQISDIQGEFENRTYIFLKLITSAIMFVTAVVFILINSYESERVVLMLSLVLYKILDAIADPLYGIMQRQSRLHLAGISMTLKAVTGFAAFVAVDILTRNMLFASLCLLVANAVFILIYDIPRVKNFGRIGSMLRGNMKPAAVLLKASAYTFSFALLTSLLSNIPRFFADTHFTDDVLGAFNIVVMPATMLNLFVQFVIQPKLVPLAERHAASEHASLGRTVTKMVLVSLGFGAVAIAAAWLIGCPVLSFIYGEDLQPYRTGLTLVVFAGTINTMTMIYSNILSVMRKFKIQLLNYLIATASIFVASALLNTRNSINDVILSFVIANAVQAALFVISYRVVFRKLRK